MHHPDLQMCTHAAMQYFERAFSLPSRGFVVLKYSSEYTGKTARLIQMMPHCSLWIVAGSPGYRCWSIIIILIIIIICIWSMWMWWAVAADHRVTLLPAALYEYSRPIGPSKRMKRGCAFNFFVSTHPQQTLILWGPRYAFSWLQWQQRVKTWNENR